MNQSDINPWFFIPYPRISAQIRLFCFHYAGGNASIFYNWAKLLPEFIEVVAIQLPGRGGRYKEEFITDVKTLVNQLSKVIPVFLDKAYMTFGHSLGTVLGLELINELKKNSMNLPKTMIVSGRGAPSTESNNEVIHNLPDLAFISKLKEYNGIPDFILNDKEMLNFFLPILRADFTLLESYQYKPMAPLESSIVALSGEDDHKVTTVNIEKWRNYTNYNFTQYVIPGGHFFIKTAEQAVLKIITEIAKDIITKLR